MLITQEFREMCDCEEVQGMRVDDLEVGDFFCHISSGAHLLFCEHLEVCRHDCLFLPAPWQLFEWISDLNLQYVLVRTLDGFYVEGCGDVPCESEAGALLAFWMLHEHRKVWTSEGGVRQWILTLRGGSHGAQQDEESTV